jgi:hypothetical protein
MVTSDNVDEYIASVIDAVIGKGVQAQARALREGFSKVFPIKDLAKFTVDELVMLFGNSNEDWSEESKWMYLLSVFPQSNRVHQCWVRRSRQTTDSLRTARRFRI